MAWWVAVLVWGENLTPARNLTEKENFLTGVNLDKKPTSKKCNEPREIERNFLSRGKLSLHYYNKVVYTI